jgi:hypothetical protein
MSNRRVQQLNESIKQVKDLLAQSEGNWVDAFLILRKVEDEKTWMMAKGGCQSFQEFLKSNFPDKIAYGFYRKSIAAVELYGEDFIRRVGVRCSHALMQDEVAKNSGRRETLTRKLEAYVRKHGVAPTVAIVWEVVRDVAPETAKRKPARRKTADLIQENAKLRAENEQLRAENEQLRAKVKKLSPRARNSGGFTSRAEA